MVGAPAFVLGALLLQAQAATPAPPEPPAKTVRHRRHAAQKAPATAPAPPSAPFSILGPGTDASAARAPSPASPPGQPPAAAAPIGPPPAPELPAEARPRVDLRVRPERAHVGEVVAWTATIDRRAGDRVTLPSNTQFGSFEVRSRSVRPAERHGDRETQAIRVDLIAFALGDVEIPPVRLEVLTHDRLVGEAHTPPARVRVESVLGNEPHPAARDLRGPFPVYQRNWTLAWVGGILGGAAIVVLATLLVARWLRGRKRRVEAPLVPRRPAWEVALEKIAALRAGDLVARSEWKEYYDRTSDLVREYFGRLHGFDGLEQTTEETLAELRRVQLRGLPFAELLDFFSECDLVKFAKLVPNADQCRAILDEGERIVRVTMPPLESPGPGPGIAGPPAPSGRPQPGATA